MSTLNQLIIKSGLKRVFIAKHAKVTPTELTFIAYGIRNGKSYQKKEKRVVSVIKKFSGISTL